MNIKLQNRKLKIEQKIEVLNKELLNINLKIYPKWVVVVDDSNCTVGVGGEGYLWEVHPTSNYSGGFYNLKGEDGYLVYNYNQSIFRAATQEEIDNWVKNKTRANVPKHGKPKLYCGLG